MCHTVVSHTLNHTTHTPHSAFPPHPLYQVASLARISPGSWVCIGLGDTAGLLYSNLNLVRASVHACVRVCACMPAFMRASVLACA